MTSLPTIAQTHCPACGAPRAAASREVTAADEFFGCVDGDYSFVRCDACASLYLEEPPHPSAIGEAYRAYYTHHATPDAGQIQSVGTAMRLALRRAWVNARYRCEAPGLATRLLARLYQWVGRVGDSEVDYRFLPRAPAKVLDYGSGSGAYLDRISSIGFAAAGVDFDPIAVARARAKGHQVWTPDEFDIAAHARSFDVVTLSHVIEHVYEPRALLRDLHMLLRPGGTIFIETPAANAPLLDIYGRWWRGLEVPRHLCIFSPEALSGAVAAAGFVDIRQRRRPSARGWIGAESRAKVPESERARLDELIAKLPPETLDRREIMTITAQKVS